MKTKQTTQNKPDNLNHDFDFIFGKWSINNRVLKSRLSNSTEWNEFPAQYHAWSVMGGLANMDEFLATIGEQSFYGLSIRLFNPQNQKWTIYWTDSNGLENGIKEQVIGSFKDGVGTFFGEELHNGKKVKLRFLWQSISPTKARWEQAYFDDEKGEWETNWIMDFTRQ